MALWSNTDANTSAPKYAVASGVGLSANGFTAFNDAQTLADGATTVQVFGVDTSEQQATIKGGHAGWVLHTTGTGGRAGRTMVETLVAMGSMSGDAEDTAYPDYRIVISSEPSNASNTVGGSASFSVTAATLPSGGSLSYQWSVDEGQAGSFATISGETNSSLSLADIATDNLYRVAISVSGGATVTSANATLTIDA